MGNAPCLSFFHFFFSSSEEEEDEELEERLRRRLWPILIDVAGWKVALGERWERS